MGNIARDEAERPVRRVRRVPLMECCGYNVGFDDLGRFSPRSYKN